MFKSNFRNYLTNQTRPSLSIFTCHFLQLSCALYSGYREKRKRKKQKQKSDEKNYLMKLFNREIRPSLSIFSCHFLHNYPSRSIVDKEIRNKNKEKTK